MSFNDPSGQPTYGEQPSYGGQPYGGAPVPPPGYGTMPALASFGQRVLAYLIDGVLINIAMLPLWIGYIMVLSKAADSIGTTTFDSTTNTFTTTDSSGGVSGLGLALVFVGLLTGLGFAIWNLFIKQGRTGYTIGKGIIGIKLVNEADGLPIGAGKSFIRQLAHIIDSAICYIGYLFPLWDAKRQTIADKLCNTLVIVLPKG